MRRMLLSASLTLTASLLAVQPAQVAAAAPSLNPADAPAGHYELDPRHASVTARVLHLGLSHYTARLDQISGGYDYDPANPTASKIAVAIDAHSLDVGDPGVSKQFAGEFLDADHNPQITFTSTSIQPTDPGHGVVIGDLTFRGVTKPVVLTVTYNGTESGMIGGRRMGFSATAMIKRSDFGSTAWQGPVGDDVQLTIEAEFARK
jgi:polyisoprenoid-binding protein YceI